MTHRGELNSLGINPGQLRWQITLLQPTTALGNSGMETTFAAANPPVTARAKIETIRGEEAVRNGLDGTLTYLRVIIRYNSAFTEQGRIRQNNGNQYIIQHVENVIEMDAYMTLLCLGVGANN